MKYGICTLSLIPCRLETSDASEMVTQLLFGDHYKVIDERVKWVKVQGGYDRYEGWIDRKQFHEIDSETYHQLHKAGQPKCSLDMVGVLSSVPDQVNIPIVMGSSLPGFDGKHVHIGDLKYAYEGLVFDPAQPVPKEQLVENAYMYLGAPYVWGGRTPFGIDCSGFSQLIYKMAGVSLPRDAYQQAEMGETLSFIEEAEEGDLAFFDNEEGRIIHVGLLLKDN
ncbi:MAG: C40 family peptidase, partial [Bacteroidota bacterium]